MKSSASRIVAAGAVALGLSACVPWWNGAGAPATSSGLTVSWPDALEVDDGEGIAFYVVEITDAASGISTVSAVTGTDCVLAGVASGTDYDLRITALDTNGEYSLDIDPQYESLGDRQITVATPAGSAVADNPRCAASVDTDGDGLPDLVESNDAVFTGLQATGTDPLVADTDGDALPDGAEVIGTPDGLDLAALGTNPLRVDILLELDWMDDDQSQMMAEPWYNGSPGGPDACGAHSHRPTAGVETALTTAFANAPIVNTDGTTGVNLIADYGQGGALTGGNLVADANGFIVGGVSGPEYAAHKAANFASERNGYFHYVLMPHRYNGSSSSGQAEINGDDNIVSLYCYNSDTNVANTIMHELGHNLSLRHGGFENRNYKPNYNSVMNYAYQFNGIETDCNGGPLGGWSFGDGVLDYSTGSLIALNESSLDEATGLCDAVPVDWNSSGGIDAVLVSLDLNNDGLVGVIQDHNDWDNLNFDGIGDSDGKSLLPTEIVTEQPAPEFFEN